VDQADRAEILNTFRLQLLPEKNHARLINQEEAVRIQEPEHMESMHDVLLDDSPRCLEEQSRETIWA
jgi:hypothetical protein